MYVVLYRFCTAPYSAQWGWLVSIDDEDSSSKGVVQQIMQSGQIQELMQLAYDDLRKMQQERASRRVPLASRVRGQTQFTQSYVGLVGAAGSDRGRRQSVTRSHSDDHHLARPRSYSSGSYVMDQSLIAPHQTGGSDGGRPRSGSL